MGSLGGFRGAEPRPKRVKHLWKTRVFAHVDVLWVKMGILRHLAAILGHLGAILGPSWGRLGDILGHFGGENGYERSFMKIEEA